MALVLFVLIAFDAARIHDMTSQVGGAGRR
jgi:hypothetical protein